MTQLTRRKFVAASGVAGSAALAGCTGGDSSDGDYTIEIGTLLPESGQLSGIGTTMVDAADLAFSTVDDGADSLGVDATLGDSQSTPEDGISTANNLANSGVPAVVGGASTNVHISAAEQVFIPNGMCACSPSATAVSITQMADDDLLFRTTPSDALQGQVMAEYATEEMGAQTAAVLHVNDDYGSALSGAFVSAFEEAGGTVQQEVSYETAATSYTSRIESAVQDDPDLLSVIGYAESGIQLFRDYYAQYSASRDIMTVDGLNTARIPNEVGREMDNVVGTAPMAQGPGRDAFTSMYQEEFDAEPGPFNGATFDAAAVLMLANAAAGENDGAAISEQMRAVTSEGELTVSPDNIAEGVEAAYNGDDVGYQGASSQVSFDDNGDLVTGTYEVWAYAPDTERGIETIETFTV
ncbi:ABC transporter substrate-binding protein [Halovivax cerinus]|uniref:ABC transporter substrate-binding protein n=1 Tax=Halovivax cerinus TaxID=1487865 RepID=A0ABD5NP46_9EURY|nr:ABC transporter substrate-binding protein [Halovivax cerinus]